MAKPNKTARGSFVMSPEARAARDARVQSSPMVVDMGRFQRGEMTAEEFRAKWDASFTGYTGEGGGE